MKQTNKIFRKIIALSSAMRRVLTLALPLALMLCASGCAGAAQTGRTEIDMNDLSGVRVGVNLAWDADYLLTERGDAEIYRYDMTADELMALNYNKIDAVGLDELTYKLLEHSVDGLELIDPPAGSNAYTVYFGKDDEDLLDSFNGFIEEFMKTDEYEEYMERVAAFDGNDYIGPEAGSGRSGQSGSAAGSEKDSGSVAGRVVRFAANDDCFPRTYFEPGSDEPLGYDAEIAERWADACGVEIKWYRSNYDDAVNGLRSGRYDAATGYMSEFYRAEVEEAGLFVSVGFCDTPIYLIRKSGDRITITGEVD